MLLVRRYTYARSHNTIYYHQYESGDSDVTSQPYTYILVVKRDKAMLHNEVVPNIP